MEGVKLAPEDTLRPEVEVDKISDLEELLIEVIKECGEEMEDGIGWSATFQLDGKNVVSCKFLTEDDPAMNHMPGIYVMHTILFKRWEDGSYLEKQVSYSLNLGLGFVSESYFRYDKDGDAKIWYERDGMQVDDYYVLTDDDENHWLNIHDGYRGFESEFREEDYENLSWLGSYLSDSTAIDPEDLEEKEWGIFTPSSHLYKKLILSDN